MSIAQDIIEGRTKVTAEEIDQLVEGVRDLYYQKPNVVTIPSEKVFFVGDVHGDLGAVKTVVEVFRRYKDHSLVFMGDYADRGPYQVETVNFIFALGLIAPDRVTILRGNHESEKVAIKYGFYMDVKRKHSDAVFRSYMSAFESLPIAGLSENGVFTCHGGIPEGVRSLEDLQKPERHLVNFEENTILQLVWNDPADNDFMFRNNVRGQNIRTYGKKAFDQFSENLGVRLMFRAHQVFPEGTKEFFDGRLVSVFSSEYNGRVKPKIVRLGNGLNHETIPL
ncbi:MAG: metallophosphoesterase [Candidatus Thorarchaeota archaeon]|jgi:protein phosphatase